ncbi:hypothetical protein FRC19_011462 [Serendipita sp. 401]|nr:hypothetical protein FRC16_007594 [Serendipita sp. 398]KAG8825406.1 hypothetical protein FRC19_011462 [Serendipita sp. 401]KAG9055412.1 hypothetical protein FS842_002261 [Serendipita sp. 407]
MPTTFATPSNDLQLARVLSIVFGVISIIALIGLLCLLLHRKRLIETRKADEEVHICVEQAVSMDHGPHMSRKPMRALQLPARLTNGQNRAARVKSMTLPIHSPPPTLTQNRHSSAEVGRQTAYPEVAYIPIASPRRHREPQSPAQPRRPPGLSNEYIAPSSNSTTGMIIIHPPRTRQIRYPSGPPPTYAESVRVKGSTR